ncbi:MAG: polysaccharide deacetylase [Oscillospiraceae bacterium]|nr:polysaccharide deacetylase [Oscillospiraceae bacterium]
MVTDENLPLAAIVPPTEVPSYQQLYPDFYAPQPLNLVEYSDKTIYLTFDDGPSPRTPDVLKILEENGVQATFFVVGQNDEQSYQWMRDIVAAGHTLGMHSYTHQYKKIYESVESYLDDMYKMYSQIKEVTGVAPTVFRFPGGSINAYNTGINQEIIAEMLRRGFVPYDWNISSEDAATTPPSADRIVSSVVSQSKRVNRGVVLMHDSDYKYTTVEALPKMIEQLKAEGFVFDALHPETQPVIFGYQN